MRFPSLTTLSFAGAFVSPVFATPIPVARSNAVTRTDATLSAFVQALGLNPRSVRAAVARQSLPNALELDASRFPTFQDFLKSITIGPAEIASPVANANTGSNTKRISLQDIIDAQRAEIIGPEEPVFPPLGISTGTGVVFPPIGLPTGAVSNTNANTKRALAFIDGLPTNALNDIPVVFPTAISTDLAPTGTNPFRQYKFGPGPVIFPTETSTPTATSTDSPTGNTVEVPPAGPTFSFPSQQAVPTPIFPFQQPGVPTTGLIPL